MKIPSTLGGYNSSADSDPRGRPGTSFGRANGKSWRLTDGSETSHYFVLFEPLPWALSQEVTPSEGSDQGEDTDNCHDCMIAGCLKGPSSSESSGENFDDFVPLGTFALENRGARRLRLMTDQLAEAAHLVFRDTCRSVLGNVAVFFVTRRGRFFGVYRNSLMSRLDRSVSAKTLPVPLASVDATCTRSARPPGSPLLWLCQKAPMYTGRPLDGHTRAG